MSRYHTKAPLNRFWCALEYSFRKQTRKNKDITENAFATSFLISKQNWTEDAFAASSLFSKQNWTEDAFATSSLFSKQNWIEVAFATSSLFSKPCFFQQGVELATCCSTKLNFCGLLFHAATFLNAQLLGAWGLPQLNVSQMKTETQTYCTPSTICCRIVNFKASIPSKALSPANIWETSSLSKSHLSKR